jgi:tetratricopeptide (TPR) repeat protein
MSMTRAVFMLALTLFALPVGSAFAQRDPELTSEDEEARSLFEAARTAYAAGRYEAALERFREAYELSGRPALLFNMATAADRLRRDEEALDLYERFLAAQPESPQRPEVEARIRILREATREGGSRTDAEANASTRAPTDSSPTAPARDGGGGGSIAEQWWFWTLIGLVVAGGITAAVLATTLSGGIEAPIPGTDGTVVMALRFD